MGTFCNCLQSHPDKGKSGITCTCENDHVCWGLAWQIVLDSIGIVYWTYSWPFFEVVPKMKQRTKEPSFMIWGMYTYRICFSFSLLRRNPWSMWSYSRHIIHKWKLGGCHVLSGLLTACDTFFLAILWRINPLWLHTTTRSLKFGYYH